jgi:hypothetical protein
MNTPETLTMLGTQDTGRRQKTQGLTDTGSNGSNRI